MDPEQGVDGALSDRDLLLQFESLGDNCELGLLQRRLGVEPLGLLRFAGAPLSNLLEALRHRFADLADPDFVRLVPENGEYMVKLTKYDFTYHSDVKVGDAEPSVLHRQMCRTIGFLAEKLVNDLACAAKIVVFRQNEPLSAMDLIELRRALADYGRNVLLWVTTACAGHPSGSVLVVDDGLMVGFVSRLADRDDVPALDPVSWLKMLRRAHAAWRADMPRGIVPVKGSHTEVVFGSAGNAVAAQVEGWSAPEAGFTWSIGRRSVLMLENPGHAEAYWLEMDVSPYVSPPRLPRQRLDVVVRGVSVGRFDPVPRGVVTCSIPGPLVAGPGGVEIVFDHPHAAIPKLVTGDDDDRQLAIAFRRVSLFCN
jgi:hypothetical protein